VFVRLLFFTDTHVRAHAAVRSDDYFEAICAKLQEVAALADRCGATAMVHGGDLFDLPVVANRLAGRVASILRGCGHLYVVPGNHDLIGHNLATVDQTTLGLLARTGVLTLLTRTEPVYLQGGGLFVKLVGQEYYPEMDRHPERDYAVDRGEADYCVLVAHGLLLPKPFHPDVPHTTFDQVPAGADLILAGHWHPGWPPAALPGGPLLINPGALARLDRGAETYAREVQVVLVDLTPARLDFDLVPLSSARPAAQVLVPREVEDDRSVTISDFASALAEQLAAFSSEQGVDVFALLDSLGLPPEEHALARAYLEQAPGAAAEHDWPRSPNLLHTLRIRGFQSHRDSLLEFVPGLNVIVGPSDAGKSAILRALWWLLYNQPRGEETIQEGSPEQFVEARFTRGTVARARTRANNGWYRYALPGGDPVVLKGFGTDVPAPVTAVHQMPLLVLTDAEESVNVATQFAPPFLLGATPTQRAVLLDALADAQSAQEAASLAAKAAHAASASLAAVTAQLASVEAELAALPDYDALFGLVARAQSCLQEAERKRGDREALATLRARLAELAGRRRRVAVYCSFGDLLAAAGTLIVRGLAACQQQRELAGLTSQLATLRLRLDGALRRAGLTPLLGDATTILARAEGLWQQVATLRRLVQDATALAERKDQACGHLENKQRSLSEATAAFHQALAEFPACPLCRRPW
jgi:exonuclease SbcC